jgi:orotate phosphoribosyltransferase
MLAYQRDFLELALQRKALRFGEFTLKSGGSARISSTPGCSTRAARWRGSGAPTRTLRSARGIAFDMLFGPAYKGIALAAATAIALAETRPAMCRSPSTARKPRPTARAAC